MIERVVGMLGRPAFIVTLAGIAIMVIALLMSAVAGEFGIAFHLSSPDSEFFVSQKQYEQLAVGGIALRVFVVGAVVTLAGLALGLEYRLRRRSTDR